MPHAPWPTVEAAVAAGEKVVRQMHVWQKKSNLGSSGASDQTTTQQVTSLFYLLTKLVLCSWFILTPVQGVPCQYSFWKFSKSKIHLLFIFHLKTIIFPLNDAEVSKFCNEYLALYILLSICKVICKKHEGGVWQEWTLVCRAVRSRWEKSSK